MQYCASLFSSFARSRTGAPWAREPLASAREESDKIPLLKDFRPILARRVFSRLGSSGETPGLWSPAIFSLFQRILAITALPRGRRRGSGKNRLMRSAQRLDSFATGRDRP